MDTLEFFKFSIDYLKNSGFGTLTEYIVIVTLIATSVYIVSWLFYSKPVTKLRGDIANILRSGAAKLSEENQSPYDEKLKTNKYIIFFIIGYFYSMSAVMFLYSLVFFSIGVEFGIEKDISWYKQFISIGFGCLIIVFSRLMKVQADRELYKFKNT